MSSSVVLDCTDLLFHKNTFEFENDKMNLSCHHKKRGDCCILILMMTSKDSWLSMLLLKETNGLLIEQGQVEEGKIKRHVKLLHRCINKRS